MFPWEVIIEGQAIKKYLLTNADYCAYFVFGYLAMIRYGPGLARAVLGEPRPASTVVGNGKPAKPPQDPAWMRYSMVVWNLLLSAFSFFGMLVIVPTLLRAFNKYGVHHAICDVHDDLTYTSACGSWSGLFVLSKIPELVDTFFLVIQKKKTPPFLHWFHHASVLIFAWFSYAVGNSTMVVFAAMNITVHAIMYLYFAVCALGWKKTVRRFAPFITTIQILQMVGGCVVTFYSYFVNYSAYQAGVEDVSKLPCAVTQANARFGSLMYLSYLYLFSKMFVESYLTKTTAARDAAAAPKKVE